MVRQLLAEGLLAVEGDYGTLALTEASADVLARRRTVTMRREPEKVASTRSAKPRGAASWSPSCTRRPGRVFERLRAWRAATAKEQGVPAYVIFHDATLRQIATDAPASLAELSRISGVGENKLAKYGESILTVLADQP